MFLYGGPCTEVFHEKLNKFQAGRTPLPTSVGAVGIFFRWGGIQPTPKQKKATQNNILSFKKEVRIRPAPPPGWDKIPTISETLRCMAPLLVKIVLNLVWLKAVYNGGGFWKRRDGERNPGSCCPIWWTNHNCHLVILLQQSPFPCYQVKSSLFAKSIPEPIEKLV